ncbi:MAG: FlgD immunoglobulin-like domain containing protein, partial [Candidatus Krumholzibacteriia bacterium]
DVPLWGHCVAVTGAGTTAGQDWVMIKHDNDQKVAKPAELKQVPSDIVVGSNGQMVLPGLAVEIEKPAGTRTRYEARVTSVVSESPKTGLPQPPASETMGRWCQLVKRTVPPGGALEIGFPAEGEGRCFNVTVWRIDRKVTPAARVFDRQWNFNKGKTRRLTNTEDYPVTYLVHNDDYQNDPYTGYDVGVNVVQADDNPHLDDAGNQFAYGGYSVGGNDFSSEEFAQVALGAAVTAGPIQAGFSLANIPARLHAAGTFDLTMLVDTSAWTIYWEQTRFVIDVLTVHQPGDLLVDCPSTGFLDVIPIAAPGRYERDLGTAAPQAQFQLRLVAQNGLDLEIDGLGAPSLVLPPGTAVSDAPPSRPSLEAWPNPFNPSLTLAFGLAADGPVELAIFDLRGRRVATLVSETRPAGRHLATWDGRDDAGRRAPAGTYLCRLVANGQIVPRHVSLVK